MPHEPVEQPTIAWTPALRELVAPRRGDARAVDLGPEVAWARLRQLFAKSADSWKASPSLEDPQVGPLLREAVRKLETAGEGVPPAASPEVEGVVLALLSRQDDKEKACFDGELVAVWAAAGLGFAVEALQASLGFEVAPFGKVAELRPAKRRVWTAAARTQGLRHWAWLRRLLAAADEEEWTAARDVAARLREEAPLSVRALVSYLFPDTAWPEEDARELLPIPFQKRELGVDALLLSAVRESDLLESLMLSYSFRWSVGAAEDPQQSRRGMLLTMIDGAGAGALPAVLRLIATKPPAEARKHVWGVLEILGCPEIAAFLGSRLESREGLAAMQGFAERFPRLALPALAVQARRPTAASLLVQVARREPGIAAELLAGLPEPGRSLIAAAVTREELPPEAEPGALPPVLASPPWQGKKKREAVRALLDADPLELFPARLPKMPAFWEPAAFTRPLLRGRTAALPLSAVDSLGAMLVFSRLDVPYAGLLQVREACDPASLVAFAWDLFSAWMAAGAPAKEQWALLALGHCGDDETARRLGPLIREWPGQASHARAVAGLDVLAAIGTEVALMHLHGIAQKVKFKGLQDRAEEKIAEIAEQRGLTPDELADRLVPDLGLGPDGSRVLGFGPRSFRVSFDEHLKPFVRDAEGRCLPDLPKPAKADDTRKAKEAQEAWKALRKDAKTLAAQQIVRLETAMCQRRRWEPEVFRTFFVEHPLLQHLVRRLVWGAWDGDGRLAGTFRVIEDGTFADIADDRWELPAGAVAGLIHRLDLADGEAARWGEVFADYEILQPFAQLGREVETLREEEREAVELRRFAGMKVPTGKILGLVDRGGWRRGPALDGGVVIWMAKPLPGGSHEARLALEPGLVTGDLGEEPEQACGDVTLDPRLPFGRLDPIIFSELVRDLERLR